MNAYDLTQSPPAPMLRVTIAQVTNPRRRETLPALLDTGSDMTAIPRRFVAKFQLYSVGRLSFEDVQSETAMFYTYAVRLTIASLRIPRLKVILTGLDFVVVGRDVLNQLYVLLNGPDLTFDVATAPLVAPSSGKD